VSVRDRLASARSWLFVPADDPRRLARALGSAADVVIADLEDGVAASARELARATLAEALEQRTEPGPALSVRVNPVGTADCGLDLVALERVQPDALVLPKATAAAVDALDGPTPLIATIESAQGLAECGDVAGSACVDALFLGAVDLALELDLPAQDSEAARWDALLYARSRLVLASAVAGLRAPIDGVCVRLHDTPALERECARARSVGMTGKACVHPAQVEVVNRAFLPPASELEWARRVLAAYEDAASRGIGAVSVEGEMVDRPVAERARRIVAISST
jgi:citrate lyase subunit beta/citryl-CoA lyase